MTAAFADAGAGVVTEASGGALSPAWPATVNAGDIGIIHAFYEGTTTTPNTPSGFTLLDGPRSTAAFRMWVYGKIAEGNEDAATNALGTPAVTTVRAARLYRFTGAPTWPQITDLIGGFAFGSGTTAALSDTAVTTPETNCLAVNLVAVEDDNALVSFAGETGGDWTEAVAEYAQAATTPDTAMQIQTATVAAAGTIDGGSQTMGAADNWGVVGFYIRNTVPTQNHPVTCITGPPLPAGRR